MVDVRGMGTEALGPWIAALARMTRAAQVLEVGAGSTSLHLARAVRDNANAFVAERQLLVEKTQRLRQELDAWKARDPEVAPLAARELITQWELTDPVLADPEFYADDRSHELLVVDDLSDPDSGAAHVRDALSQEGLDSVSEFREGDFRQALQGERERGRTFELVVFDCGDLVEYQAFLDGFLKLVDPAGGLLLLHGLLRNPRLGHVLHELRYEQLARPGEFELVSLLEPHKYRQNSVTLLKRTAERREDYRWPDRILGHVLES